MSPGRLSGWILAGTSAGALAGFGALTALWTEPISQQSSHEGRLCLALLAMALVAGYVTLRPAEMRGPLFQFAGANALRPFSARWSYALLISMACVWGAGNYYQFDRHKITELNSYQDSTYYYLNSKYFDELSYFSLYPALLLADEEAPGDEQLLREVKHYRDLHDYKTTSRSRARTERETILTRFTPARWNDFKHDARHLVSRWPGGKRYFFSDHGYNPPPTWTIVGGTLSSMVPVEHLWWLAMIDFVLVAGMFVLIARTYGFDTLLFGLLFFLCTFSGRWPMLGESILRFDWLAALVVGTCFLHRKQTMLAGLCLAYAALNRVFPAIFYFAYLIPMALYLVRNRRLSGEHLRFLAGSATMTAILVGAALASYGVGAFADSLDNLLLHQSSASFSRYRIGFGDALVYRGEQSSSAVKAAGGMVAKAKILDELKPLIYATAACSLGFIAWWGRRSGWAADRLIPLIIVPLFILTNPQINYFNLRLLLVCWHATDFSRARNRFGMLALFGIEAITQYSHVVGNDRYATTALTSVGLTFYFAALMLAIVVESRRPTAGVRHAWSASAIALALLGGVYWGYWHLNPSAGVITAIDADRLSTVREEGTKWNAPGTVQIAEGGKLSIRFARPVRGSHIDISFDNNDTYHLRFLAGTTRIGVLKVKRRQRPKAGGLARERFALPTGLAATPFDTIEIRAKGGDRMYSVGHVRVSDE
ncbi:MAG: hypothetical protein V3V08_26325 [Nannocystaceae bacterium]